MATTAIRPGAVTFSVHLRDYPPPMVDRTDRHHESASELAGWFAAWDVPVTWVVDELNWFTGEEQLARLGHQHEIALAADPKWAAAGASRRLFTTELSRRLLEARAGGHSITTLFLRGAREIAHPDLARKHGLTVICPFGKDGGGSRPAAPVGEGLFRFRRRVAGETMLRAVRFGLWQIAALECWPSDGGTFLWIRGLGRLRRAIDHAEAHRTVAHLLIDGAELLKTRRRGQRALEKVLRYAESRRHTRRLQIDTLAGLAARLSATGRSVPSHSILRPAA